MPGRLIPRRIRSDLVLYTQQRANICGVATVSNLVQRDMSQHWRLFVHRAMEYCRNFGQTDLSPTIQADGFMSIHVVHDVIMNDLGLAVEPTPVPEMIWCFVDQPEFVGLQLYTPAHFLAALHTPDGWVVLDSLSNNTPAPCPSSTLPNGRLQVATV